MVVMAEAMTVAVVVSAPSLTILTIVVMASLIPTLVVPVVFSMLTH